MRRSLSPDGGPALLLVWALGLALFAAYALWMGEDANWDLQNYHDYGPYALLHGRYRLDVAPAGIQGYFNPLPYLLPYGLRHALSPRWAAVALAAVQALTVLAAWMLSGALATPAGPRATPALRALATVAGVASAMALSEIGTTFADLALAAPVLWGLLALLRARERGGRWLFLLAGLLVGATAGLKPTNLVLAAGLAVATILPWRSWPAGWGAVWRVGLGGLAGVLLTGGAWAAYLWLTLDNPVFPAMNHVFRSASAVLDPFADLRFVPPGLRDALLYPLWDAIGLHPTAEQPFTDARLLLALPLSLLALLAAALRRGAALPGPGSAARAARLRMMVFLLVAAILWLLGFAIHRYVVVLDILGGMLLVTAVAALTPARLALPAGLAVASLLLATTRAPDWWHRPWDQAYDPAVPAPLAEPAGILVAVHPMGHWVSRLPKASRFYAVTPTGLASGGLLRARIEDGIRQPPGGRLWILGQDLPLDEATRVTMASFGIVPTGPCLRAEGWMGTPAVFCGAVLGEARPLAAPDLALGESVDFTAAGRGWTYLLARPVPLTDNWQPPTPEGSMAEDGARLVLRPAPSPVPLALDFELRRPGEATSGGRIAVLLEGRPGVVWEVSAGPAWSTRTLCLLAGDTSGNGVVTLAFQDAGATGASFVLRRMTLRATGPERCP